MARSRIELLLVYLSRGAFFSAVWRLITILLTITINMKRGRLAVFNGSSNVPSPHGKYYTIVVYVSHDKLFSYMKKHSVLYHAPN